MRHILTILACLLLVALPAQAVNPPIYWGPGNAATIIPPTLYVSGITTTGASTNSKNGAASTPAMTWSGDPYTGGTTTTTKPLVLLQNAGTSNAWSTNGTYLGVNAKTGFTGMLLDAQLNAVSKFSVSSAGVVTVPNSVAFSGAATFSAPASNGTGALGAYSTSTGLTLSGKGSATDILIANSSLATVASVATGTTAFDMVSAIVDGSLTLTAGRVIFTSATAFLGGTLQKVATDGMTLSGITGSSYDLSLTNPGGTEFLANPTGTTQASFPVTTDSSSSSTGAVVLSGGMGIAKKLYVGTDLNVVGKIVLPTASTFSAGSIQKIAGDGMTISGITGSSNDLALVSVGGQEVVRIPTGTSTVNLGAGANSVLLSGVTTGTNADFLCMSAGGVILLQTSACTISSQRFKKDIEDLDEKSGIEEVLALRPVQFRMKEGPIKNADNNFARLQTGLIAEDVAKVDPRLAIYEQDGVTPKSYRQEAVISVLVKAVQEQQAQIEGLKKQMRSFQH